MRLAKVDREQRLTLASGQQAHAREKFAAWRRVICAQTGAPARSSAGGPDQKTDDRANRAPARRARTEREHLVAGKRERLQRGAAAAGVAGHCEAWPAVQTGHERVALTEEIGGTGRLEREHVAQALADALGGQVLDRAAMARQVLERYVDPPAPEVFANVLPVLG